MRKIRIDENFNLIEVYDTLLESRGVIEGIEGLCETIYKYINTVLGDKGLKEQYKLGYDKNEKVTIYSFIIPNTIFNDVDTLFMTNPTFNIQIFVMDNVYGDRERELGQCNYESLYRPVIEEIDGTWKLSKPVFNLFFIVGPNEKVDFTSISEKVGHEIVHAKKNFFEYITMSKKRKGSFNRDYISVSMISSKEKNEIEYLIGRILYLCSKDEINARANQLYFELMNAKPLNRKNINNVVRKTNVYGFVNEFDEKIELLFKEESKRNINIDNSIKEALKLVYLKDNFSDPYKFLYNLLINRKNYFIRQIDKVKEKVLYETMNKPVKI